MKTKVLFKWFRSGALQVFLPALLSGFTIPVLAKSVRVSGTVIGAPSNEPLMSALVSTPGRGAVTDLDGNFFLTVSEGQVQLEFAYMGYKKQYLNLALKQDTVINITLYPEADILKTVTVSANKTQNSVENSGISVVKLEIKDVKDIPVIFGEVDVMKTITLLPGVQSGGEGGTGLHVRGGGQDQNLILLDDAPIYNASHLMGFFSVFNGDAIEDLELYKGGIPARYGGRLSSLVNIGMKDGNKEKLAGSGGIGTITSRLMLEGPLVKDKSSFMIAGRRSYADVFAPLAPVDFVKTSKLYFYDLNLKASYQLGEKDRFYLSGYYGRDVFALGTLFGLDWGNGASTLRWNHVYGDKLVSNTSLVLSKFDYGFDFDFDKYTNLSFNQDITDYSIRSDYNYYLSKAHTILFGVKSTLHDFNPGSFSMNGDVMQIDPVKSVESSVYTEHKADLNQRFNIRYGLRYTVFVNLGGTLHTYTRDHSGEPIAQLTKSREYRKNEISNLYHNLEPRVSLNYSLKLNTALKATYNRTTQYIQQASNTASAFPTDQWFSVNNNVKPQIADQVAVGIFRDFDLGIETSAEAYFKKMKNQIDYRDGANLFVNEYLDGELFFGEGWSYGAEFMAKKVRGSFTGFISYTLAKSTRQIYEINDGLKYPTGYDQRHNLSVVMSQKLGKRWVVSGTFVFNTGNPYSPPVGKYYYDGGWNNVYGSRNNFRVPNYHRADLGITFNSKESDKRFKSSWNLSVYNVYNRENPYAIYFPQANKAQAEKFGVKEGETIAVQVALFKAIPSITWNFTF